MTERFQVKFLEEANEFLDNLDEKARDKVIYNIHMARSSNDKELDKTPIGDIEKAERLRKLYFERKEQ